MWRSRDFRLVFAGSLVNNIGDWMLLVALPVYVFTKSRSGAATAAVFVIELVIGVLLGPYGGSLADRWNLRRTLIATNVLQAVTLLPLLAVTPSRLWPAFVVVALQSALRQVNDPASFALLPRVVKPSQLVPANAANSASFSVARLIGSPAGGIAVAFGGLTSVVIIDSVTFAAVAVAMGFVRTPTGTLLPLHGETGSREGGVRVGLREIKARPPLMAYVVVQALAQLAFAMFPILFIVFVVEELHGGGSQIGIIRGMAAFGGIVAALIVPRWARTGPAPWLMMWGYLGLALSAALFHQRARCLDRALALPGALLPHRSSERHLADRLVHDRAAAVPPARSRTVERHPVRCRGGRRRDRIHRNRSPRRPCRGHPAVQRASTGLPPVWCRELLHDRAPPPASRGR